MRMFEAVPKTWGNSLGVTIPREIVNTEGLSSKKKIHVIVISEERDTMKKIFGKVKLKRNTQEVLDEMDEENGD